MENWMRIMANDYFRFKKFLVIQDKATFKVGTDSVLLGSWSDVSLADRVLDIGTGTGLLAIMIAQRCSASITGIEIDGPSFRQACENAGGSPWSERINILHTSMQEYTGSCPGYFDLIICNPPFFTGSLKSGNAARDMARHDTTLSLKDLAEGAGRMLAPKGRICLVMPADRYLDSISAFAGEDLFPHRELIVKPTLTMPAGRCLFEFRKEKPRQISRAEIVVERSERHDYTDEYRQLTGEFYLAF